MGAATNAFWKERLEKKKEQLVALDEVLAAFAANTGLEEYLFDTGQTQQRVRRADLSKLRLYMKELESQIVALQNRLGEGCGVVIVRPGW